MQRLRAAGAVLEERPIALARFAGVGIVGLLLLFSLFLRLRGINSHLWVDEGLSVGIARHPLSHIPSLMRQDGSPPLYYMLLHLWISLRGHGEVATHELSLIFSLLTIPAAYWLGNGIFGRRAGLTAALLAATVPYLTVYAQETRMYSLLALLALVTAGSFVQAFVWRRRLYLPVFVVSLVAALYTHNWALFLGLMSAIAFLVVVRGAPAEERRLLWIDGAIAFGAIALLFAPWLPTVAYQSRHTGAPWDLPPVVWSITQGMYSVVGGRGAAIALLLGGGAGLLAVRRSGGLRDRWPLSMGCLLLLGAGTMLVAWTYSKLSPAWAPRYLAVVVGPLILLFGLGLSRGGRLAAVALALTLCFWVFDPMGSSKDRKSNVASAVKAVKGHVRPGTLVLSTQPEQVPTLAYYLPSGLRYGTPLGPISDPHAFDWRDALSRFKHASLSAVLVKMVATLQPGQRVLLLVPLRLEDHPAWMKLINKASNRWMSALNHNPSLRRITYSAKGQNKAGVPVKATIWVKRGQTASA
jgi:4-amino-4-deoxy-L-arabinose transferase-like glycosyltransferase